MNIKIKNVGKIKSANIKFGGLTVIAGENDSGKSTVGKLLFSIIKVISTKYENEIIENKNKIINNKIRELYQNIIFENTSIKIIREFSPISFNKEISLLFNNRELLNDFFKRKELLLKKNGLEYYIKNLNEIKKEILKPEDKQKIFKKALTKAFYSEFYFEISPKGKKNKSHISLEKSEEKILDIEIEKNKITNLKFEDIFFEFDEVTFIETPLFVQMYNLIKRANILFDKQEFENSERVSLHIKDLINKLEKASNFIDFDEENKLLDEISKIINGKFIFDYKNNDFVFLRNENKIKIINTASGIKSFGIIQLLIYAEILNERNLLIIDEPENHLHPEWQVKYAKIIIKLVENGVPIILSSHSPYMIQALKFFSDKSKISKCSNFYFAENKETRSEIIDVTNNLNIIFSKLAKPLNELVWKQ